jgi:hypothetical protein
LRALIHDNFRPLAQIVQTRDRPPGRMPYAPTDVLWEFIWRVLLTLNVYAAWQIFPYNASPLQTQECGFQIHPLDKSHCALFAAKSPVPKWAGHDRPYFVTHVPFVVKCLLPFG